MSPDRRRIPPDLTEFHGMVTVSDRMRRLFVTLERVARSEAAVLVRGETGTGKELVARAIHSLSPRREGPFRALNCATLTPELMVSELFGHVRGAFTGATQSRDGAFSLAHGGTLFLDEIAELPLDLQARLLRVLQEQEFIPLGGTRPIRVDVRILSATHKALRREVEARRFREDLMYRIRVVPLFLPRLAEREGDVEALTWRFIHTFNAHPGGLRHIDQIDPAALAALQDYPWPGNIRELRNVLEHAYVMGEGPLLRREDFPPELRGEPPPGEEPPPFLSSSSAASAAEVVERAEILRALETAGGRRAEAADILGISRSTLWRRMRELGIQPRLLSPP